MQNTSMYGSTAGATTTGQTTEDVANRAGEKLNQFTDAAQQTMDRVTQAASDAASRLSARGEELWAMRGQATDTARTYMREHPLATIGIAVAIGLILSRLLSRR
jgi:ElaB/YqjD/DUF883 family membrane-anchored ribosome-binding protein